MSRTKLPQGFSMETYCTYIYGIEHCRVEIYCQCEKATHGCNLKSSISWLPTQTNLKEFPQMAYNIIRPMNPFTDFRTHLLDVDHL